MEFEGDLFAVFEKSDKNDDEIQTNKKRPLEGESDALTCKKTKRFQQC